MVLECVFLTIRDVFFLHSGDGLRVAASMGKQPKKLTAGGTNRKDCTTRLCMLPIVYCVDTMLGLHNESFLLALSHFLSNKNTLGPNHQKVNGKNPATEST